MSATVAVAAAAAATVAVAAAAIALYSNAKGLYTSRMLSTVYMLIDAVTADQA